MEDSNFKETKAAFLPNIAFKEIYAIPFNHWKLDNEWMVLIIIDGESIIEWLNATSPEEASKLALEKALKLWCE